MFIVFITIYMYLSLHTLNYYPERNVKSLDDGSIHIVILDDLMESIVKESKTIQNRFG